MKTFSQFFVACLLILSIPGCATYKTLSDAKVGSAKMFSGTRLDVRAIGGETATTKQFPVTPPQYPAADLPFSAVADFIALPLTFCAAIFEALFE